MSQVLVVLLFASCFVSSVISQGNLWREDGRCGKLYPLSDKVTPGQCDPLGDGPKKGPCCSNRGFCGNTKKHCNCKGCQDFSQLIGVLYPAEKQKSSPLTEEKEYGNRTGVLDSLIPQEQQDSFFNSLWDILSEPVSYVLEGWNDNKDELPDKVSTYVEKVATNGAHVLREFYNGTQKEVTETTNKVIQKAIGKSVDDLTNIFETFIGKIENVYLSVESVVNQKTPKSEEDILLRAQRKNLAGAKKELDDLKEILPLEKEENSKLEGLEAMLLTLVTQAREIISLLDSQADLAWSKIKQLEAEAYQVISLVAGTSSDIRETLLSAFQELNKQLSESSPVLQSVIQRFDLGQLNGTDEAPRSN